MSTLRVAIGPLPPAVTASPPSASARVRSSPTPHAPRSRRPNPCAVASVAALLSIGSALGCNESRESRSAAQYIAGKSVDPSLPGGDRDAVVGALTALANENKVCVGANGRDPELVFAKGNIATAVTALEDRLVAAG